MARRIALRLSAWCGLVVAAAGSAGAAAYEPLSTARLLVDLARDYGLNRSGRQTAADVQHVRALLRGAVRLEPAQPEAYRWLYELAVLEGDREEAGRMLTGLVNAQPTNQGAFALWLQAGLESKPTIEERIAWLQAVSSTKRPPSIQAVVHVALARLALDRLEPEEARRQVERALELEPASIDAARMWLELQDGAAAAARLRALLRLLALTPLSVDVGWEAGVILDESGFCADAGRLFEHAASIHQRAHPGAAMPADFLLDWARNLEARGALDAAADRAREATQADERFLVEAGMYLWYLLELKAPGSGISIKQRLAKRLAEIRDPAEFSVNEVAQAAWFYMLVEPQPDRALMLAQSAAQRAEDDVFVRRILGWAQAKNGQSAEALATLRPITALDPYAAWLAARLLREAGDEMAALLVIARLDSVPTWGPARQLFKDLPLVAPPVPASEQQPEMVEALSAFDAGVLTFCVDSGSFLEAQVGMEDASLAPGQPWWATFILTNRGSFPITLEPDAMVNPVFLLSFKVEGDRQRAYPALTTVSIDTVRVLLPGESVRFRQTLDIGPLRQVARQTPQQAQRVVMDVLLDAVLDTSGHWHPGPTGQRLRPVYFNRLPAATGGPAVGALFEAVSGEVLPAKLRALEVMAELVGEWQRAELRRLEYRPAAVPAERMQAALLDLLGSTSWELRARTLIALDVMGLNRQMVEAVSACLDHPHWLVRMLALRVLARQGPAFSERAETTARDDPDELVRMLAESYMAGWRGGQSEMPGP